ncbi:MAG: hypothetical protein JWM82_4184, partial [Myxococcales bacterium]|nr:hypothetical protein [Myxococcales bacterium]
SIRSSAPKAGAGAFQITNPGVQTEVDAPPPGNKKMLIGLGVGALAVVGIAVAVLGGGKKAGAPAPVVAAVAALATVKIEVTSTPSGASVIRAEDGAFLGRTPFHVALAKSSKELDLVVKHEGYEDQRVVVPLLEDGKSDVTLTAVAKAPPAPVADEAKPAAAHAGKPAGGGHGKSASSGGDAGKGKAGGKKKRDWGDLVDF